MRVSKWGDSLAVRLPDTVVDALGLKEGDEVEVTVASKRKDALGSEAAKQEALEQLRRMKWSLPADFQFDRDEIHER